MAPIRAAACARPRATLYSKQPAQIGAAAASGRRAAGRAAIAARTRSGVIGSLNKRAPVASKMALAITAPVVVMGGSPPPCGANASFLTKTTSIRGTREKLGISYVPKFRSRTSPPRKRSSSDKV